MVNRFEKKIILQSNISNPIKLFYPLFMSIFVHFINNYAAKALNNKYLMLLLKLITRIFITC